MKRIVFLTILIIGLTGQAFAVTSTTSSAKMTLSPIPTTAQSTSSSIIDKSIELLKQRIATSVAKIEKNISKLNVGYITKIDKAGIVIKTKDNKSFNVNIDNTITKIYTLSGVTKKEIKFDTLALNDYVIISGPPLENSITANNIYVDEDYVVTSGKVTEVDNANFTVKVFTVDKDDYTLNIENSTKQMLLDIRTNLINATGFSKIKVGDTVHFVAKKPTDLKNLTVTPLRMLIIPQEYFMK
jgi:hypothetical protein